MSLPWTLTAEQRSQLETRFPHMQFVTSPGSPPHAHAVLATERQVAEDYAYKALKRRLHAVEQLDLVVVDIGGNPSRHKAARRKDVHSCCPILTPADAVRNSTREGRMCQHLVQECGCVTPDGYLSIHSLYYLTLPEIVRIVYRARSRVLVAVVHDFSKSTGYLGGREARYTRDEHTVHMNVHGNSAGYSHSAIDWIKAGYHCDGEDRKSVV